MNSGLLLPFILQIAGVGVIIAEIILPSGGLLSIAAACLFGYSLYSVFAGVSVTAGWIFAAVDVVMIPILVIVGLKLLARSPATLRKRLSSEDGVISQSSELEQLKDMDGIALTDLRPSGAAEIGGKKFDVVSRGDYIKKGTTITIHSVTGNQIIVFNKRRL